MKPKQNEMYSVVVLSLAAELSASGKAGKDHEKLILRHLEMDG